LVVDDERSIVDMLIDFLSDEGYSVSGAFDGVAALQRVHDDAPDLILADIMMPRLDGLGLLVRIRAEYDDIPVVLMSAAMIPHLAQVPYIAKPFDLDDLLMVVEAQFAN
jgi:DNA-binding response OmpR family regulator